MTDCEYKMCDEEASEELLEQLKRMDGIHPENEQKTETLNTLKRHKLKTAIGHVGLMVSLSIYCAVGGLVSLHENIPYFY